jgi:hypothetical protein
MANMHYYEYFLNGQNNQQSIPNYKKVLKVEKTLCSLSQVDKKKINSQLLSFNLQQTSYLNLKMIRK